MRIGLSQISGLDLLDVLAADQVRLPVILMTAPQEFQLAAKSLDYEDSYVLKMPFSDQELLTIVGGVMKAWCSDEQRQRELETFARIASLSPRQRQILTQVFCGVSNRAIANKLGISVKTVELHRSCMMKKMRAESLIELIKMATPYRQYMQEW